MSWGAVIGAGASILGGALASKSAGKASDAQGAASADTIAFQRESRDQALALQKPYRDASYQATAALMDLSGLPRRRSTAHSTATAPINPVSTGPRYKNAGGFLIPTDFNAPEWQAPVPAQQSQTSDVPDLADYDQYTFQADPGYQFRMDEGNRALERGAAARGGLLSGGFARKALRYAQDYASNEYTNVYNRIANIAGFGQVGVNNSTNAIMMAGGNVGNAMINAGEARASGYVAQGNAWANAINQIGQLDWESAFGKG